jgi:hypothetical protein
VPFDAGYERNFVALIAAVVSLGRTPHCVLELPELGSGRLSRLFELFEQCRISIHDLSRVGVPVRFNMPFELGLACALARYGKYKFQKGYSHDFIIMEKTPYRLDRTLSDLKGIDPLIHNGSSRRIVSCVLEVLHSASNNPNPVTVSNFSKKLWKTAEEFKRMYSATTIFNRSIFNAVVSAGLQLAVRAEHLRD